VATTGQATERERTAVAGHRNHRPFGIRKELPERTVVPPPGNRAGPRPGGAVLDTIGHHKVDGDYDAGVVDQQDGKPHVVKRLDHRLRSRDSRVRRAVDNHLLQLSHHRAGLGARQGRAGQY
jgi:hypothetical protein